MLLLLGTISFMGAMMILLHRLWTRALHEIEKIELQQLVNDTITLEKRAKAMHL